MVNTLSRFFRRMNSGYYNYLLLFLALLFACRPYNVGILYIGIWKLAFTVVFFTAIFNIKYHRGVKILAVVFAIPTIIFTWLELYIHSPTLFVISVLCTIIFLSICATSVLFDVVLRAKVTLETLRGVVCAYFMIAFVFAYVFYLNEYLFPNSFKLLELDTSFVTYSRNLSEMMYFSFVTLLTIGYGDVTPLRNISQTFVVLEGIIGQFYVAILVAKIVAVYSFIAHKNIIKTASDEESEA